MIQIEVVKLDKIAHTLDLMVTFTNPLDSTLGDIRAIFKSDGAIVPVQFDGYTLRMGAPFENPDPFIAFAKENPKRWVKPDESTTREIFFKYKAPLNQQTVKFMLDATVNGNTAEPYDFGEQSLTSRFLSVQISDWQDDVADVVLHAGLSGLTNSLRLASFGENGEWGTSIPDIPSGNYRLLLTAESPESAGEDNEGQPVTSFKWVEFAWPPPGPIVPLPIGQGIYGFRFIDPDTNTPPVPGPEVMDKFVNEMKGKWIIVEYGGICNSGYLSMHSWIPLYVQAIHSAAPEIPIHLNFDKGGFQPVSQDPCQHKPIHYTKVFFDHLLESIRGQILEDPAFDCISGLHFDIEIYPSQYTEDELFDKYRNYGDFLGQLHKEPLLSGRNITVYDFEDHPHKKIGDLAYLCTADAFLPEAYYDRFTWDWDPSKDATPFAHLEKELAKYGGWSEEYGRPYYPILGTFSGWFDGNHDTLQYLSPCKKNPNLLIDEFCFGNSDFHTINEFDIVKATDVHHKVVENVILELTTDQPIFPSNGFAVYRLGDGFSTTVGDDIVACRTSYGVHRAVRTIIDHQNSMTPGYVTWRYENDSYWKAPILGNPDLLGRGNIGGISGHIKLTGDKSIFDYPKLWGRIRIELVDPPPEIIGKPYYRTSIDIVGVKDGSYIFPDLPLGTLSVRAVADGWHSEPVTVDLKSNYAYIPFVDLVLVPD